MASLLIIDDDPFFCRMLSCLLIDNHHQVTVSHTIGEGLEKALSGYFDVVFLDVNLPDGSGLDILSELRRMVSAPEVIIITGIGDPDGAELAIKCGAWDYIEKPATVDKMLLPLLRALQYREEKTARKSPLVLSREGIIGNSHQINHCLELAAKASVTDASVLITGETGTGKELFASAIHKNSPRTNKSFVVVDCTSLPVTLVESTLFGHKEGAFTGATKTRDGLLKQADGGTLFLDEVGELDLSIQKTLLRVLQEHRFRPVGGEHEVTSSFRVVAATNRDLDQMVKDGQFRKDLLFRLRSVMIHLPTLRERIEDVDALVFFHLNRLCSNYKVPPKTFSPEIFGALRAYDWPGNVRELVNVLESMVCLTRNDPTLYPCHLPVQIRIKAARSSLVGQEIAPANQTGVESDEMPTLKEARQVLEREYFRKLAILTGRNIEKACRISGLSRARFYQLIKEYSF